jgi:hypothetical protein
MAAARYPITSSIYSKSDIIQLRSDYVAGLRECKARPVYFARTSAGDLPCHCEPLTLDDTKGWQMVKHGRGSNGRASKSRVTKEYTETYDTNDYQAY